jgi:hypothetical protein
MKEEIQSDIKANECRINEIKRLWLKCDYDIHKQRFGYVRERIEDLELTIKSLKSDLEDIDEV